MTIALDLAGRRFGKLLVIERTSSYQYKDKDGKTRVTFSRWKCVCDCGKKCIIIGRSLVAKRTTSCGCRKYETKYPEGKRFSRMLSWYRSNAKRRGISFTINDRQFANLITSPCFYTGKKPAPFGGIDRKNPSLGYTARNCVPCSKFVNRAKSDMSEKDFLKMVSEVYEHKIAPK